MARRDDPEVDRTLYFGSFFLLPQCYILLVRRMDTQVLEKKKTGGYYSIVSEAVTPGGCWVGHCYQFRYQY